MGFYCPSNQYPYYNDCSICFSVASSNQKGSFSSASGSCGATGGQLITFTSVSVLSRLGRYLEGLGLQEEVLWVGYTYQEGGGGGGDGAVLTDGGEAVDEVVLEELSLPLQLLDRNGNCVGVSGGELAYYPCSSTLAFICTYTYSSE